MAIARLTGSISLANLNAYGPQVYPSSMSSGWKTLPFALNAVTTLTVGALGANTMAIATSVPFYREMGRGTNLRVRVIYDDDATAVTKALTYRVWGRKEVNVGEPPVNEDWQVLQNRDGDVTVEMLFAPSTDPVLATDYRATQDTLANSTFDCDGCDEFFIQIVQEINFDAGSDAQARFQVKLI